MVGLIAVEANERVPILGKLHRVRIVTGSSIGEAILALIDQVECLLPVLHVNVSPPLQVVVLVVAAPQTHQHQTVHNLQHNEECESSITEPFVAILYEKDKHERVVHRAKYPQ